MQASLFSDNVPIVKSTEAYAKEAESAPRRSWRQRAALASTEGHGIICRTHQSYKHKVYKLLVLYGFRCPNNFQAGTGQRKRNEMTFLFGQIWGHQTQLISALKYNQSCRLSDSVELETGACHQVGKPRKSLWKPLPAALSLRSHPASAPFNGTADTAEPGLRKCQKNKENPLQFRTTQNQASARFLQGAAEEQKRERREHLGLPRTVDI